MPGLVRVLAPSALNPNKKFGSLEEQILVFARRFAERGSLFHPLFLYPLEGDARRAYEREGLVAAGLDLRQFSLDRCRILSGLIREHGVDVVHWNFYGARSKYVAWLRLRHPRVQHYITNHDSRLEDAEARGGSALRRVARGVVYRGYRRVLGVSDYVSERLAADGCPSPGRFWHFVNTERFRPDAEARARVRAREGAESAFVVVAVARLIREKGLHVAIDAIAQLPDRVVLWVVGDGVERKALMDQSAEKGVADRVRFLGGQWYVESFLQGADVAICPSIWQEAAGLINLEALAAGLPVVASRVGGIPEFVTDGVTGRLVPAGDAGALATALRQLCADEEGRAKMATAARRYALERLSAEALLDQNLAVYHRDGTQPRTATEESASRSAGASSGARPHPVPASSARRRSAEVT